MWGRADTRETACPGCLQSRRRRASDTVGTVTTLCMSARKKASVWKAVEPIMALDWGAIGSKLLWPNGLYNLVLSMVIIKQEQLPNSLIFLCWNNWALRGKTSPLTTDRGYDLRSRGPPTLSLDALDRNEEKYRNIKWMNVQNRGWKKHRNANTWTRWWMNKVKLIF